MLEGYKNGEVDKRFQNLANRLDMKLSYPTAQEYRELLLRAGYADAQIFEQNNRVLGWMCGIGTKAT